MPMTEKPLRVLIVDDNRDGADVLGLLVEELGNQAHVTYGGKTALEVAMAFRPDLMFIDLLMPEMDGRDLVTRFRQIPAFSQTKIVAITGQKNEVGKSLAIKAGFDAVLYKPAALSDIKAVLASVVASEAAPLPKRVKAPAVVVADRRLPIDEARRIRNTRKSRTLTQAESEAAICDGIIRFQEDYMGWRSEQIYVHSEEKGRDLIKQVRKQLLEVARPMLESLVHEVAGVRVLSMHHDISTVTGEEVIIFSLAELPRLG
jgi:CheY-like chemotaxis protein/uncharacterized protein YbcI